MSLASRIALLAVAGILVFGVAAAILLYLIPAPRRPSDYLLIGTTATLAALGAVFAATVTGLIKSRDIFYKRRPRTTR